MKKIKNLYLLMIGLLGATCIHAGETGLVSVNSAEMQGNDLSYPGAISADGRYIAFSSYADNLVSGDTNGVYDVFVRDSLTGKTRRVSVSSAKTQGNNYSESAAISANGRYVLFGSLADNLVEGDTNGVFDAFVRDIATGKTARVSVNSAGVQGNNESIPSAISADGRYVVFSSIADNLVDKDTNGSSDVFIHDRLKGTTKRLSVSSAGKEGNNDSESVAISADGRYVAFSSWADNLVAHDNNGVIDAFVHDCLSGKITRVSVSSKGREGNYLSFANAISADGRYVAFRSTADNLVTGDTNGYQDIFVRDRLTGQTTRASVSSTDAEGNDEVNDIAAISANGRYIAFTSWADNLVDGDTNGWPDAFIRDRFTGKTSLVSVDKSGGSVDDISQPAIGISADARYVMFGSWADDLVAEDTNGWGDVFVRDRLLDTKHTADLTASATVKPVSVTLGQTARYTFKIKNHGPNRVGNVSLNHIVFNGKVLGITTNQGDCSKAAVSVCNLGSLPAKASISVTFDIKATANPLKQQISVNGAPKDNVPGNNVIKIVTPATP